MNYLYPIVLTSRDGETKLIYSADEFRSFAFNRKNGGVGTYFDEYTDWHNRYSRWIEGVYFNKYRSCFENRWIARDDRGRKVDCRDFELGPDRNRYRRVGSNNFEFRNGPVPFVRHSKPWKMNHTAKKNSGSGHRNRNRAKAIYEAKEFGVKNNVGGRVIPWEHY